MKYKAAFRMETSPREGRPPLAAAILRSAGHRTNKVPGGRAGEGDTMKAVVRTRFGGPDVLALQEVEKPVLKEDQVLVRVRATSLNLGDWHSTRGRPYIIRLMGLRQRKPTDRILGWDLAGRVEAVGANVKEFRPGDEVFGSSIHTLAEVVGGREEGIVRKPWKLTFQQAAAAPVAGDTASQGPRAAGGMR